MLDVPAGIKKIKEVSNVDKVAYMGYSQGSTIMFYALTKEVEETFFTENISCFIALAPCMIPPSIQFTYESFISTEWQGLDRYPNMFSESFDVDDYCDLTSNGFFCQTFGWFDTSTIPSADTRSIFQYT